MHNLAYDTVNKTADFDIHDEEELDLIKRGLSELIRKQERKTVQKSINDYVPPQEIEKLERYKKLNDFIKVGAIRFTAQQMFDLENAINEGIVKYEKEVTDNPEDETIVTMSTFKKMIHNVLRDEVLNR